MLLSSAYVGNSCFGTADDQRQDYRGCVTACGHLRSSMNSGGADETCQSSHTIDGDDHKIQLSLKNINQLSSSAVQQKLCGSSGCQRFSWPLAVRDCLWFLVAAWGAAACGCLGRVVAGGCLWTFWLSGCVSLHCRCLLPLAVSGSMRLSDVTTNIRR